MGDPVEGEVVSAELVVPGVGGGVVFNPVVVARRGRGRPSNAVKITEAEFRRRERKKARRDRVFTNVALLRGQEYVLARLSDRERKLITVLLESGSIPRAAEEIGISTSTVRKYMKRPFVVAYLEQMRQRMAGALDLTSEKVARVINAAVDGVEDITEQQLKAASIAARILNPENRGTNITVNQQNNYGVGTSPFAGLKHEELLLEMKRIVNENGVGPAEDGGGR